MTKWPIFRFSLLTVMLVLTLAAVSVSHLRMSRELTAARQELELARRSLAAQSAVIRDRNNELGILTIDDPTQVHVISASAIWKEMPFYNAHPPHELCWRIHVPKGTHWKVWWATAEIPAEGIPEARVGGLDLDPDNSQAASLTVQFVNTPVTKWDLIVSDGGGGSEFASLPVNESRWLTEKRYVVWEGPGGDQHQAPVTAVFPPDQPIVIQRVRGVIERGEAVVETDPNPTDGFMIWIEPINVVVR